jgi:hypothetical protein
MLEQPHRAQEDTVRVVAEKTTAAERWHAEAARLFGEHAASRDELESLAAQVPWASHRKRGKAQTRERAAFREL